MISNPTRNVVSIVTKTEDETVTESTVLQADDQLTFPVVADGVYLIQANLYATFGEGDIKLGFSGPTMNFTSIRAQLISDGQSPAMGSTTSLSTGIPLVVSTPVDGMIQMDCAFAPSANGTITLVWAQNTSNVTGTVVKGGSYLVVNTL